MRDLPHTLYRGSTAMEHTSLLASNTGASPETSSLERHTRTLGWVVLFVYNNNYSFYCLKLYLAVLFLSPNYFSTFLKNQFDFKRKVHFHGPKVLRDNSER